MINKIQGVRLWKEREREREIRCLASIKTARKLERKNSQARERERKT